MDQSQVEAVSPAVSSPSVSSVSTEPPFSGAVEGLQTSGSLEVPKTPERKRGANSEPPRSPVPSLGIPQISRNMEDRLGKLDEAIATFERDITGHLDKLNRALKDIDSAPPKSDS